MFSTSTCSHNLHALHFTLTIFTPPPPPSCEGIRQTKVNELVDNNWHAQIFVHVFVSRQIFFLVNVAEFEEVHPIVQHNLGSPLLAQKCDKVRNVTVRFLLPHHFRQHSHVLRVVRLVGSFQVKIEYELRRPANEQYLN